MHLQLLSPPTTALLSLLSWAAAAVEDGQDAGEAPMMTKMLNCTPPAVDDFPDDGLTFYDRRRGWVVAHLLVALYAIGALAIACDDYFVPIMHEFSESMSLPSDVAGATLMAFGTSCPELFVSLIGAFVTQGDIGLGAVIGSAVFNILAIASICGLFAGSALALNWRPLTRDCAIYVAAVTTLLYVVKDEKIYWYEAAILVVEYIIYILVLYFNWKLKRYCRDPVTSYDVSPMPKERRYSIRESYSRRQSVVPSQYFYSSTDVYLSQGEKRPQSDKEPVKMRKSTSLRKENGKVEIAVVSLEMVDRYSIDKYDTETLESSDSILTNSQDDEESCSIWTCPRKGWMRVIWVVWWPVKLVYHFTIPSANDRHILLKVTTFVMSVAYIGCMSYICTWMVSVIGDTLHVPDSVMGLTVLALGSSLPEIVSSIIVTRQSLGNMALANAMGGNAFTLLMCLGMPWLIKATVSQGSVAIHSKGMATSVGVLLVSVILMFVVMAVSRFRLNRIVGIICLVMYIIYVTFSTLYELNVFSEVNLPMCSHILNP